MRTNIVLDDKLVKEAFSFVDVSTKKELIDIALREFVNNHRRAQLLTLRGQVHIEESYDYKTLRQERS
ncbi:MAG: type II toxin-antitoxin system VapB family antitoxin [Legionellales bacterium]|nr:type II toxin-antitoxin system VapB family antitoxin [Legionellales bacterium]